MIYLMSLNENPIDIVLVRICLHMFPNILDAFKYLISVMCIRK